MRCLAKPLSSNNPDLDQDFRYAIKQHGAMLAKGRLLGLQFLALLNGEDGTGSSPYYTMAAKADRQAMRIRAAFEAKGCAMLFDSPTNQPVPHPAQQLVQYPEREVRHDPDRQAGRRAHCRAVLHQLGHP